MKHVASGAGLPTGTSPKATKTPDLSEPTSECNGRSTTTRDAGLCTTAASWDSQRSRPRFQQLLFTVAGLALLPATAATAMRVVPPSHDATAQLAAFVPYGILGYLIALVCLVVALVRARRRLVPAVITVAVAVLTACHAAWLAPLFVDDHRAAETAKFRLMSLNMFDGEADPGEIAEQAHGLMS